MTETTTARQRAAAKAAAKPMNDAPAEDTKEAEPTTPPAEETAPGDRLDGVDTAIQSLAGQITDLQAAQDSDHDAIVGLSDELGSTNNALKNVITQLQAIAEFRKTAPEGVEQELELGLNAEHISAAVIKVMRDVREVGKSANAPAKMGGYAFRKVDDIMNAVGASMRNHGVFIRPEFVSQERKSWTSNGSLVTEVVLTMRYHWVSGVDGTSFDVVVIGEGRDNGDKATSKAQAMCYKTMLLQTLCIPLEEVTGFDVERDDTTNMAPDRQQAQRPPQRQETAYGYGHQPQQSPGGQAHAQAQQAPPPPPERTQREESPEELATRALAAARRADTPEKVDEITRYASDLGVLQVMVENAQLQLHLTAQRGVLAGAMPGPDAPNDEPPWDNA